MKKVAPDKLVNFDQYAASYEHALAQGLAATGEDRNYFARRRLEWLKGCLDKLGAVNRTVVEFGCGTGSNIPFLIELLGPNYIVGLDPSEKSLQVASSTLQRADVRFALPSEYRDRGKADLVFCNGVLHHVPRDLRTETLKYMHDCLRNGGLLALWENNPWNPGTRYVMSRIPFDEGAITLNPFQARRLVRAAGFEVLRTDFLFIFPHCLRYLRRSEKSMSRLPLGGQYQLLCRKPA